MKECRVQLHWWCLSTVVLLPVSLTLSNGHASVMDSSSNTSPEFGVREVYRNRSSQESQRTPASFLSLPLKTEDAFDVLRTQDVPDYQEGSNFTASNPSIVDSVDSINLNSSSTTTNSTRRRTNRRQYCSKQFASLQRCIGHIPPIPDIGIPSTPQQVEATCKAFNMGMACVDDWTGKCLAKEKKDKVKASIIGAHETFTFLCRDSKFRQEFLKHGDCHKRISPKWDECSKHFIENMKRFHTENSTIQCCVRLSFLQCVSEISHYYCNKDAAKFLQRMAETLVRATMKTHVPPQCISIQKRNCSVLINSSVSLGLANAISLTFVFDAIVLFMVM